MSMLSRFRKKGGFSQLLALIETCEPEKKQNLLTLVGAEDPGWAHLISIKALSFERIMSWPVESLMEVTPHLPDQVIVIAYHMLKTNTLREKWLATIPRDRRNTVMNQVSNSSDSPAEHFSVSLKIIKTVRDLDAQGAIKLAAIDPTLALDIRLAS